MMWPFGKSDSQLELAMSTLNPFVIASLGGLNGHDRDGEFDRRDVRTLATCYVYGAVRYLASYDGMTSTNTGVLLEQMLATHFQADCEEIRSFRTLFSTVGAGDREQLFMTEGASALRRWLVNGDRAVGTHLRELLDSAH